MLTTMAAEGQNTETVMIDATQLKAHRTVSSLRRKKGGKRFIHCPAGDCMQSPRGEQYRIVKRF